MWHEPETKNWKHVVYLRSVNFFTRTMKLKFTKRRGDVGQFDFREISINMYVRRVSVRVKCLIGNNQWRVYKFHKFIPYKFWQIYVREGRCRVAIRKDT